MNIIFDLDGTLTDPQDGICKSVAYALTQMALPVPPASVLRTFIGPPLQDSFQAVIPGATPGDVQRDVQRAIAFYRERFAAIGLFENRVYAAIPPVLEALRDLDHQLWVATSKPQVFAQQILDHFELSPFFSAIHGSELDGTRSRKADLLAFVLQEQGLSADHCWMVGDRHYDVTGALANHIPAVGVTWGYGTQEELETAGARWVIDQPEELLQVVDAQTAEAPL
ncbi:MAG: HAD family hydrolase [Leptolyngbya sp. RL_3_1]|nr:HAD family hydrolase [Leptolyngbya sp. RL_3_1]